MMTHTTQTFKNRAGKEKKLEIGTAQAKQFAYECFDAIIRDIMATDAQEKAKTQQHQTFPSNAFV